MLCLGEGVNIAFVDAWKLSIAIIDAVKSGWQENLDTKVAEYENNMFVRAKEVTEMTDGMMKDSKYASISGPLYQHIEYLATQHVSKKY